MIVLEPISEARPVLVPLAQRVDTLVGKKVGFVDNSKPNVTLMFDLLEERLKEQYALGGVLRLKKRGASMPLERAQFEQLAKEYDVAIVAMCD